MNFDTRLENYISLLIERGLNVQPGQEVLISFDVPNRGLALKAAQACYLRGAGLVTFEPLDFQLARLSIMHAGTEELTMPPEELRVRYDRLVDKRGARLFIDGLEDPGALEGLDPNRVNAQQSARYQALKRYYKEGINQEAVQWCVAAAATPGWAESVFPNLSPADALERLWAEIFKASRADRPDTLRAWDEHDETLHRRADRMNSLKISELHFTGGGTDLRVGLSERAIFRGGSDRSVLGHRFNPNIPSEEVFSTPDYRRTKGTVRTTRPFMVNGVLVDGLELSFENGEIVDFSARAGGESFEKYISRDEGARRLGEVALVGIDSPIYQSGAVFRETLFDENASCHIAVGSAYASCIKDGTTLEKAELDAIGFNDSVVHSDMMISSEQVDVTALTYAGDRVPLIIKGEWVDGF